MKLHPISTLPQEVRPSDIKRKVPESPLDSTEELLLHFEYMSITLNNLKNAVGGIQEPKELDITSLAKATVNLQTEILKRTDCL